MQGSDRSCFFKQETAYEIMTSLVGSEQCIRDSTHTHTHTHTHPHTHTVELSYCHHRHTRTHLLLLFSWGNSAFAGLKGKVTPGKQKKPVCVWNSVTTCVCVYIKSKIDTMSTNARIQKKIVQTHGEKWRNKQEKEAQCVNMCVVILK